MASSHVIDEQTQTSVEASKSENTKKLLFGQNFGLKLKIQNTIMEKIQFQFTFSKNHFKKMYQYDCDFKKWGSIERLLSKSLTDLQPHRVLRLKLGIFIVEILRHVQIIEHFNGSFVP